MKYSLSKYLSGIVAGLTLSLISSSGVWAESVAPSSFDSLNRLSTEALARIGEESFRAGDHDRANEAFTILRTRYDESADEEAQRLFARCFLIHGNNLYEQGAYSMAMESLLRARRISENNGWGDLHARSLGDIGNIYASNYDYVTATDFYRRALEATESLPADSLKDLRASVLNNLTGTYSMRGMVDSARIFSRRFELLGDMPDLRHRYDLQLTKALVEHAGGNHRGARRLFRRAISIADSMGLEPIYAAAVYSCLASSFEQTAQLDSALIYMHLAADVAADEGYMNEHIASLRDLARIYEAAGDKGRALWYRGRYVELADSVRLSEERDKLHTSEMLYALDSNATTIQGLNAIRTLQWRWLMGLTILLLVVAALLVIVLRQKNALSQAWNNLYERNRKQMAEEETFRQTIETLENRLAVAEKKTEELLSSTGAVITPEQTPVEGDAASADTGDTSSRSLTENRSLILNERLKKSLAQKIKYVMEETDLFCLPDFSIERLAAEVGSNARYVSEVVNDVLGLTFRAMLNEYRVKRAMHMLSDPANYGHLTIKAIGESVGYRSASTFISVFSRQTGLKPSIYHKLALEKQSAQS